MSDDGRPALKDGLASFERIKQVGDAFASVRAGFDRARFLAETTRDLDAFTLMERIRRIAGALDPLLPTDFGEAVGVVRAAAPKIETSFLTLALCDWVAIRGIDEFDPAMEALRHLTVFCSAEFAVRPFLRRDLTRTLAVMETWTRDPDARVRRLASEGCRPRLPWSFRLDALIADPSPTLPILEALRTDPSVDVRRSVANHINDVTKDNPEIALAWLEAWSRDDPGTAWIVKHALRSLIKRGSPRALALIGVEAETDAEVESFSLSPASVPVGGSVTMRFRLRSTAKTARRFVIDYAVHYVKKSGETRPKVFKLRLVELAPGEVLEVEREHDLADLSTRRHHPGRHAIELLVNGASAARGEFTLESAAAHTGDHAR